MKFSTLVAPLALVGTATAFAPRTQFGRPSTTLSSKWDSKEWNIDAKMDVFK